MTFCRHISVLTYVVNIWWDSRLFSSAALWSQDAREIIILSACRQYANNPNKVPVLCLSPNSSCNISNYKSHSLLRNICFTKYFFSVTANICQESGLALLTVSQVTISTRVSKFYHHCMNEVAHVRRALLTRAFSLLNESTSAFILQNLLWHYAE